ncbi:hypothetical protein CDAR_93751 [Caerostris darwini]|uniref:Uncharacterized protein n=1 Tax=Caerostris darwini TaxID=1538125 RepID=A0AAV4NPC8_9ARAC|nr:hypothetical protein CDAR_93751 [Caerostris darwini]
MDKSPPNQVQPQLSGPSTSSSTPQENLTAQILQSLVKENRSGKSTPKPTPRISTELPAPIPRPPSIKANLRQQ